MDKKWTIPLVIVLAVLFVLAVAYIADNQHLNNSGERMSFNVSSGSYRLSEFIKDVKTKPYYKGYDAQTVKWMESLGNKNVYFSNDSVVIMNGIDAMKLPETPGITDVYIYDLFTAEVIETHSLGDGYPTVYYVKNVKDANQEIISNGLA